MEPTGREKENAKDHAVFDRARFLSLCGADTVHSHTLLDVDRGIGDKEQRLIDLVVALAQAKGEVARLSSVKEVSTCVFMYVRVFVFMFFIVCVSAVCLSMYLCVSGSV